MLVLEGVEVEALALSGVVAFACRDAGHGVDQLLWDQVVRSRQGRHVARKVNQHTRLADELLALCVCNEGDSIDDDLSSGVDLCILSLFDRLLDLAFFRFVCLGRC